MIFLSTKLTIKNKIYRMVKLITVNLRVPNGLNVVGVVQCHNRDGEEHQIPHRMPGAHEEFPGPHWEIEVSDLISQILPKKSAKDFYNKREREEKEALVKGTHIEIGKDLRPYICFPNLPRENMLVTAVRIWLTHQALYNTEGIDFGLFEGFVLHNNQDFEDWLEHGNYMEHISEGQKVFLRTKESLFSRVREIYHKQHDPESGYSGALVAHAITKVTGISIATKMVV